MKTTKKLAIWIVTAVAAGLLVVALGMRGGERTVAVKSSELVPNLEDLLGWEQVENVEGLTIDHELTVEQLTYHLENIPGGDLDRWGFLDGYSKRFRAENREEGVVFLIVRFSATRGAEELIDAFKVKFPAGQLRSPENLGDEAYMIGHLASEESVCIVFFREANVFSLSHVNKLGGAVPENDAIRLARTVEERILSELGQLMGGISRQGASWRS